jgi:hypothetical protein
MASRYIDYTKVYDESKYYESEDSQASQESFASVGKALQMFKELLRGTGFDITAGDEL